MEKLGKEKGGKRQKKMNENQINKTKKDSVKLNFFVNVFLIPAIN